MNKTALVVFCVLLVLIKGEYLDLLPSDHIYEVMPTRKIYKINFQWDCWGWSNFATKRDCEEGEEVNPKLMRLYRKDLRTGEIKETTTIEWDARKDKQLMWINSTFRQNNDFIKQWIITPLDMWDYTYADETSRVTNMTIHFTGSHLQIFYNDYKVVYIWLRDQTEDITYTTHVKLEKGFHHPKYKQTTDPSKKENTGKGGRIYWYYGDESMWCWVNCSQKHVYNFSGYYDEVLSPRTDSYQVYLDRQDDSVTKPAFCTYYNCTRDFENYPSCLLVNFTAYNTTSGQDEELLDLSCVNRTYKIENVIARATEHWASQNVTNLRRNYHNQQVPDDPQGVGIVDGIYHCLQRDYCHDLRPFQLFNFEGSAHLLSSNVVLLGICLVAILQVRR